MKKVFLDFGANRLQGLKVFQSKLKIDETWVIQAYEANKEVFEQAKKEINCTAHPNYQFSKYENFQLHNIAVSDNTGKEKIKKIIAYNNNGKRCIGDAGGSTLITNVVWHQKDVEFEEDITLTLDVNEILDHLCSLYGMDIEIYIKCDIEGYEYKVVKRLLEFPHIKLIKQIYIEWHPHFFENQIAKKAEAYDLIRILNHKHSEMLISMHY